MPEAINCGAVAMSEPAKGGRPSFEEAWRKRFEGFAQLRDDDAGIAGWSPGGLEARMRAFTRAWTGRPAGELWLDAGCGAGTYSRYLANQGLRVVGLDYSLLTAAKAKARDSANCLWVVSDVTKLPLRTGTFDGVVCFGVMQALSQSAPAIVELARQLRPGGQVWVDALNGHCAANLWVRFSRWLRGKPRHLRYESPGRMARLMREAGLIEVQVHWIPILPSRLRVLEPIVEGALVRALLRYLPGVGPLLCHSCLLTARSVASDTHAG